MFHFQEALSLLVKRLSLVSNKQELVSLVMKNLLKLLHGFSSTPSQLLIIGKPTDIPRFGFQNTRMFASEKISKSKALYPCQTET